MIHCNGHADRNVESMFQSLGAEAFSPRIPRTRAWNGHKPLFPGYVFVRLPAQSDLSARLRSLPGIRSVISVSDTPIPVSDDIVSHIRRRTENLNHRGAALSPGDPVAVVDGPFKDLEGIFCATLSGEQRVVVLLNILRGQTRVHLPAGHIVPAFDPAAA